METKRTRKRQVLNLDLESCVRSNTGSAALTAGLLIFFGFFWLDVQSGTDAFSQAATVFVYTLRLGGLAMALVAGWCSFGQPLALLGDAIVSCIIGALVLITSAIMVLDGGSGVQGLISVVCAVWFISVGLRNGRDFLTATATGVESEEDAVEQLGSVFQDGIAGDLATNARTRPTPDNDEPNAHLVQMQPKPGRDGELPVRGGRFTVDDNAIPLPDIEPLSLADVKPPPPPKRSEATLPRQPGVPPAPDVPPAPEGFLADLADDDESHKP